MLSALPACVRLMMWRVAPDAELGASCRPLLKACVDEQRRQQQAVDPKRPPPVLLEPRIKLFVEGTEVKPEDHIFIRALKESKCINKEIDVKEVIDKDEQGCSIVLGWCTFAYQASCTHSLLDYVHSMLIEVPYLPLQVHPQSISGLSTTSGYLYTLRIQPFITE